MMIEFIGSTGAGKTRLIGDLLNRMGENARVTTSYHLMAERLGLPGTSQISIQHLLQELVGIPFFLRSIIDYQDFLAFSLAMLARQANFSIFTVNNLRSLERKLGVYTYIRAAQPSNPSQIVLVDEGTILSAHNIFVYSSATYTSQEIDTFAKLVPLPDLIVYLRVPVEVLVQRTLHRQDPPREVRSKNPLVVERYTRRASGLFDRLVKSPQFYSRLLLVEYSDFLKIGYDRTLDILCERILSQRTDPARMQVSMPRMEARKDAT